MAATTPAPHYPTPQARLVIRTYDVDPADGTRTFRSVTTSDEPSDGTYHHTSTLTWPECRCPMHGGRSRQGDVA
ncbi:hypothetical protein ACIQBJ_14200 [Kitasatospora sp. NPDC088391]|uniref:hypothetical protein n=1 Tax=Kitasatospora sp. NPDC088391 TaxID=3364074 RepID=UPI003800504A